MKTILLVDDNPTFLAFTARQLVHAGGGVTVARASSFTGALDVAAAEPPALAVVDARLPDGDGVGLIVELRRRDPALLGVVVTGDASPDLRQRALDAGAFAVLSKPVDAEELLRVVTAALAGEALPAAAPPPSGRPAPRRAPRDKGAGAAAGARFDRHAANNLLASLLTGLRALEADVADAAGEPARARELTAKAVRRMAGTVRELARIIADDHGGAGEPAEPGEPGRQGGPGAQGAHAGQGEPGGQGAHAGGTELGEQGGQAEPGGQGERSEQSGHAGPGRQGGER
jgi:CheY-like chemotaxis protein